MDSVRTLMRRPTVKAVSIGVSGLQTHRLQLATSVVDGGTARPMGQIYVAKRTTRGEGGL
jgi:hypothetical protein